MLHPVFLLTACTAPRAQRGGHALTAPLATGGLAQTLVQSDNPSGPSRQTQDTVRLRTYNLPAATPLRTAQPAAQDQRPSTTSSSPATRHNQFHPADPPQYSTTPILVSEREETHATTELGAAQKDTTREIGAKLSSLKSIVWVGLALFVFGLASLFWLPLKTIIGSTTTSAAITAGGLALMVLPTLIVGNELLILGGVTLITGAWFLAHRHGHLRGQLAATTQPGRSVPTPPPAQHPL